VSPLRKRIAYKKKGGSPLLRYIMFLIIAVAAFYLLFYHRFENKTIYETFVGYFKSEVEKSPSITIINADKEAKKIGPKEYNKEKKPEKEKNKPGSESSKDEIEEVIRKKLNEK